MHTYSQPTLANAIATFAFTHSDFLLAPFDLTAIITHAHSNTSLSPSDDGAKNPQSKATAFEAARKTILDHVNFRKKITKIINQIGIRHPDQLVLLANESMKLLNLGRTEIEVICAVSRAAKAYVLLHDIAAIANPPKAQ